MDRDTMAGELADLGSRLREERERARISQRELARRLDELESRYDRQFKVVFDAIRELMTPAVAVRKRRIGFISDE